MKKIFFIIMLLCSSLVFSQTTSFIGVTTGNWSSSGNWDNGVPNSSTVAQLHFGNQTSCIVDVNADCFSLVHYSNYPMIIQSNVTLTVHSSLDIAPGSGFSILGNLKTHGDLLYDGTRSIEVGGSIELGGNLVLNPEVILEQ